MTGRTMVKIERTENFLYFRTIKRSEKQIKKSPGSFAVPRHAISNLDGTAATLSDGGCYAKLWLDPMEKEVVITFSWLHEHSDGTLIGWRQTVRLPYEKLARFDDEAYDSDACNVLRLLSRDFLPPCLRLPAEAAAGFQRLRKSAGGRCDPHAPAQAVCVPEKSFRLEEQPQNPALQ